MLVTVERWKLDVETGFERLDCGGLRVGCGEVGLVELHHREVVGDDGAVEAELAPQQVGEHGAAGGDRPYDYDVVLIDGRFRLASALHALTNFAPSALTEMVGTIVALLGDGSYVLRKNALAALRKVTDLLAAEADPKLKELDAPFAHALVARVGLEGVEFGE